MELSPFYYTPVPHPVFPPMKNRNLTILGEEPTTCKILMQLIIKISLYVIGHSPYKFP